MSKKRTRKDKIMANKAHVNSQFEYSFNKPNVDTHTKKNTNKTAKMCDSASIKKELFKSLGISLLILISLLVLYWAL